MSNDSSENHPKTISSSASGDRTAIGSNVERVTSATSESKNENGLLNILFNVIIPVFVLNKLSKLWHPTPALLIALAFPLAFGLWDLLKKRKVNGFSLLGLVNISVTGSLALLRLDGIWFSVKEALFPALIGVFVFFSRYTKKPFIKTLFLNPQLLNLDLIEQKLVETKQHDLFELHIRQATSFLAMSFVFSAVLNFVLAQRIFLPLPVDLDDAARSIAINDQIAHMTGLSAVVILIPSVLFLAGILWYLISGIAKSTGLSQSEIFKS